jgi:hypothetical protein
MSEENEPPKTAKPKKLLAAAIVRWFFAAIFAVLLILAIVFQAAWKIIAIFAVLAAGLTLLPKSYRKWFYAAIGTVVLVIIIWVFLPDNNQGWRPYTFDNEIAALNAKYAVPDQENAAIIYNQLPKLFDDPCVAYIFEDCNIFDKLRREPWTAHDYPKYADWLDNHQQIINLLLQTTQYERCYFGTKADIILDESQMQVSVASRHAAQLLSLAANYDIGKGQFGKSLEKYHSMICIGNHFQENLSTINKLVGISVEALAIRGLRQFLIEQNASAEQIGRAEAITSEVDCSWNRNLPQIIQHDELFLKDLLANYYEINSRGRTRFARDPLRRWREYYKKMFETDAYTSYWMHKLWKAYTVVFWLVFPAKPQTAGQIINEEYQPYYKMAEPDYDWQKEPKGPTRFLDWPTLSRLQLNFRYFAKTLAKMNTESYSQLHGLYVRLDADKRGTLLLAALKLYKNKNGSWPDSH